MIPDNPTPAQAEALEELAHRMDLINSRPTASDIDWTLAMVAEGVWPFN